MSAPAQTSQPVSQENNSKELNFRRLEERYERQLAMERAEKERLAQELAQRQKQEPEEEDDNEPYVDKKKLEKKLEKFGQKTRETTQSDIQRAVQTALQEERRQNWLKANPDFGDVLKHAESFAAQDPELADTILEMPDTFERQKLVYKTIKAMGIHKPKEAPPTVQQVIDANRRSPFYQPSSVGTAPYSAQGDFSAQGKKAAYEKMQELKQRMRLG